MDKTFKIVSLTFLRRTTVTLLCGMVLLTTSACAKGCYTDEKMQPLAATATDLARAVIRFAKNNPGEAASLDDQELVRRATAFDPNLLESYKGLVVRGTVDGVILVCTGDGKRGLFEDAECSDKVDKPVWADNNAPCEFTLKLETVCP
jgi:hypothetical protein